MRKAPQQARSREMVERLLEAAREVLVSDGYDAFSTNRVAATAGVSPGSLYQYFPDKGALLDVVLDRYWDEVSERTLAALSDNVGSTGSSMVRATADALLTAVEADPELLRVLTEELPTVRIRERRGHLERRVRDLLAAYLALQPQAARGHDPRLVAWVVVMAVQNLALRWVLDRPDFPRDALLDEITALAGTYLPGPR